MSAFSLLTPQNHFRLPAGTISMPRLDDDSRLLVLRERQTDEFWHGPAGSGQHRPAVWGGVKSDCGFGWIDLRFGGSSL
ncbi:hypothetical protein QS257_16550 [Terrilactibacillus sp. S3-3]|nr:hypothetical protein QS257_16550 [Terrilactibacillus sp. S3-3]